MSKRVNKRKARPAEDDAETKRVAKKRKEEKIDQLEDPGNFVTPTSTPVKLGFARFIPNETPEKDKRQGRNSFIKDYDKITFSSQFRRLQDKTQVYPLAENDIVHTRLTHSMEVACVGRSLGRIVGRWRDEQENTNQYEQEISDVVAAACLAHDIGNPPFGHQGEEAMRSWWKKWFAESSDNLTEEISEADQLDFEYFEGNAFGLRVLKKLKVSSATLAAYMKYPCSATSIDKTRLNTKKNGFYSVDAEFYGTVAKECDLQPQQGAWQRHPSAFLVEAADDICYRIMDLEDAARLKIVSIDDVITAFNTLLFPSAQRSLTYGGDSMRVKIEKLKELRAKLIGEAVNRASQQWISNYDAIDKGTFNAALMDTAWDDKGFAKQLQKLSLDYYNNQKIVTIELSGYRIIGDLMDIFVNCALVHQKKFKKPELKPFYEHVWKLLPESYQEAIDQKNNTIYQCILLCADYVAGMTDTFATNLHKEIMGVKRVH